MGAVANPTPPALGDRFVEAVGWAVWLHDAQVRKASSTPYVAHLLAVSSLVLEYGGDEDEAIAALLHDALEDTNATRADVEERFGGRVAGLVAACSDTERRPKPPWRERKEQFLARLRSQPDPSVLRIVAADKIHNSRSMVRDHRDLGAELWDRFNAGPRDQVWYHREVAAVVRTHLGGPVAAELDEAVDALAAVVPS
jgi:(p)ppGpp synthase/HD superfamily hydrolase